MINPKNMALCALFIAEIGLAKAPKVPKKPAVVRHVGGGSRGPYVVIDGGSRRGYVIGADICLYNDLGQETGCGTIEQTNAKAAGIRLAKDKQNAVAEGNRAWSLAWGPLPVLDGYAVEDAEDDVNNLVQEQQDETPKEPPLLRRRISYEYVVMPSLPVSANNLEFDAKARAANTGNVWVSGSELSRSLVGLSVNFRMPKPGAWDHGVSLGYNFMQQVPVSTDFDVTDSSQIVESSVSAHFYHLGYTRGYSLFHRETFDLMLGAGLEAWMVVHKFRADHSDTSSLALGSIYNGLLTLPVSVWTEWAMGGWQITSGIDVQMPLYMKGNRVSGQVGYSEDTAATKDLGSIGEAIAPKKRMGYAIRLGFGGKI